MLNRAAQSGSGQSHDESQASLLRGAFPRPGAVPRGVSLLRYLRCTCTSITAL